RSARRDCRQGRAPGDRAGNRPVRGGGGGALPGPVYRIGGFRRSGPRQAPRSARAAGRRGREERARPRQGRSCRAQLLRGGSPGGRPRRARRRRRGAVMKLRRRKAALVPVGAGDLVAGPPPDIRFRRRLSLLGSVRELWRARELIRTLTEREFRVRYKQAYLGF